MKISDRIRIRQAITKDSTGVKVDSLDAILISPVIPVPAVSVRTANTAT
jgi:hypothetical protein